jgi:selenocysteine lyase/cysteine desulfurase
MGSLVQYIVDFSNGSVSSLIFNATYPLSNNELVIQLDRFLEENQDPSRPIRIALIDHITSVPGVIVPIENIIPMLKARNITVLIDGAHAIGQIPVNITALDPDYYITNCHKWLYSARGAAVLYVNKKYQSTTFPANINAAYRQPSGFQEEFFWTGTMDYSPYLTVPAALEFRKNLGGEEAVRKYNHELAVEGGNYLASKFATRVLQDEDQIGNMVDVQLPLKNHDDPRLTVKFWTDKLLKKYSLYAPPYKHNGRWWIRVSAQIYTDMDDFQKAADVFLAICSQINRSSTNDFSEFGENTNNNKDL